MDKYSQRFKDARKYLNRTQQELADSLKVSASLVKNIEAGNQKIPVELADKLEIKYGINMKWLLLGKGEMSINYQTMPYMVNIELMSDVMCKVEEFLDERGVKLELQRKVKLMSTLYALMVKEELKEVNKDNIAYLYNLAI